MAKKGRYVVTKGTASHPATQISKSDVVLHVKFTAHWATERWADALDLKLMKRSAGGKTMGGIW